MLPLKFYKVCLDRHLLTASFHPTPTPSPNCRAIRDSVTPALKVIFTMSGRAGKDVSTPCCVLLRRFISSSVAACIKSNSPSLKCLTALRRFLGRTCRRGSVSVAPSIAGDIVAVGEVSRTVAEQVMRGLLSGVASHRVIMPLTMWVGNQHSSALSTPEHS